MSQAYLTKKDKREPEKASEDLLEKSQKLGDDWLNSDLKREQSTQEKDGENRNNDD